MRKYKVGYKVKVVGRPEWTRGCWSDMIAVIGEVFVVTEVEPYSIKGKINGEMFGLYPESVKLVDNQLMFSFMYEED